MAESDREEVQFPNNPPQQQEPPIDELDEPAAEPVAAQAEALPPVAEPEQPLLGEAAAAPATELEVNYLCCLYFLYVELSNAHSLGIEIVLYP